ncbi:haloacid dehalogenase-like hydrolase domain-containing protein sgpp [Quercus suber]|uniref:Haloacid dehalogenase-like hydrolase domain-containing protein sgpp n=1 Tax=Quercus suber TaxID=58331 RepID=A0AAW0LUX2_QUESU
MTEFSTFEFQEQEFLNEDTDFLCQKLSPLFPSSISLDLHPQQQKDLLHEIVSSAHKIFFNHYNSNSTTNGNNKRWLMLMDLHIFTTYYLSSESKKGYAAYCPIGHYFHPLMELRRKKYETSSFYRTGTGFNGRLLITEEFFVQNIAGMHHDDITDLCSRSFFSSVQTSAFGPKQCTIATRIMVETHEKSLIVEKEIWDVIPTFFIVTPTCFTRSRELKRAAVTNAPKLNTELMISVHFFELLFSGMNVTMPSHTWVAGCWSNYQKSRTLTDGVKGRLIIKDYEDPKVWAALEKLDKK